MSTYQLLLEMFYLLFICTTICFVINNCSDGKKKSTELNISKNKTNTRDIETDLRSKSFYEDTSNLPASPNKSSSHALNHNYEHGSPTVKEKTSFNFLEPPPATQYNRFIPKSPPCLEGSLAPQYNTEHPEKYMNKSEKQLQEYPVNHQLDYNQPLNHQLVNNQQMNNQQMNDQPINKPPAKRQALLIPAPPKPLSPIEIVVPKEPYHIPPVNHPNYIDNIQKDAPNIPSPPPLLFPKKSPSGGKQEKKKQKNKKKIMTEKFSNTNEKHIKKHKNKKRH